MEADDAVDNVAEVV
jgi:hypothetical protein